MMLEFAHDISGVVLAGGENKRYGGIPKSKVIIGGKPVISRIIDTISEIFSEIIIVTNTLQEYSSFGDCIIVGDEYLKVGPLGGIHASMKASARKSVFVFAGDMPFLDRTIIMQQIEYFNSSAYDSVIPRVGRFDETLHAIYRNSLFIILEKHLASGEGNAVKDFLKKVKVDYWKLEGSVQINKAFTNINSPSGAEEAENLLKIG
jgi:molybdopterin-guanine dinucleotide biosynthesis protein A